MKTKLLFVSTLLLGSALVGAPLPQAATIHARPSASSPSLGTLPAGAEPSAVTTGYGVLPSGWIAVSVKGPHEVFIQQKDLTKSLDPKPGAPLHREPNTDSDVLTTGQEGDITEIIDLRGRWTQLLLKRDLIGYIQVSTPAAPAAAPSQSSASPAPAPRPAPPAAAPAAPVTAGQAVPFVQNPGEQSLPRLFQGRLTSTRNPFRPRRPYDYQLTSEGGERYAYADLSKLLLTEQLDKYLDRTVVVYGAAQAVPGTQDIVIVVESLQLR
jgi:hypothetical protein